MLIKRFWGIRHIRWFWLTIRFALWWHTFASHIWFAPNQHDEEYLNGVWRGEI